MGRGLKRVALAASTALALATALLVGTASAAGADPLPDLSTRAAIEQYLVSIGVDPATAVWQTGLKNYAGPGCPGVGWNCVRANAPIVQIAAPLGTNLFRCSGVDCVAVQVALKGGNNGAACERTDKHANPALQECDITQVIEGNPNNSNTATITQSIQQSREDGQDARQIARITQTNGAGNNIAGIHQVIVQTENTTSGSAQAQEAHQAATVTQATEDLTASQLGNNNSNIDQRQTQSQKASGGSIVQSQNVDPGSDATCDQPEDLTPDQQKNQCAAVTQHSGVLSLGDPDADPPVLPTLATGGGRNGSNLSHQITQRQVAQKAVEVEQLQGAFFTNGEEGFKDQLSSGVSTGSAVQDMRQTQIAPPEDSLTALNQDQDTGDPRCCWRQFGNEANRASIDQATIQTASSESADQTATLNADCSSSGICHTTQSAVTNDDSDSTECTASECHEFIICGGEGPGCFSSDDDF
jgi:hypothetical protein